MGKSLKQKQTDLVNIQISGDDVPDPIAGDDGQVPNGAGADGWRNDVAAAIELGKSEGIIIGAQSEIDARVGSLPVDG